jgi:seryl-tRNA synthetase
LIRRFKVVRCLFIFWITISDFRFQDTRALQHRATSTQKMAQLRAEERGVVAKMEEIQRDVKHLSADLQHLEEEEDGQSNSALSAINSLNSQKNEISNQLSEVQQEINTLLAQLRTLQQKESSLQSDLNDIDICINDENAKLHSTQSTIKNQVYAHSIHKTE